MQSDQRNARVCQTREGEEEEEEESNRDGACGFHLAHSSISLKGFNDTEDQSFWSRNQT